MSNFIQGGRRHSQARAATWVLAALLALGWSAISGAAPAQADPGPRYRRGAAQVRTSRSLQTKLEREKKRAVRDANRGPQDAAALANARKAVAMTVVEQQIATLHKLLRLTAKSDPDYPDLLFRLADLHLSVKAHHDLQAGALDQIIYDLRESGKTHEAASQEAKQQRHRRAANKQGREAIKPYAVLASDSRFANYKRLDEALYYYAFELGQLGEHSQMQKVFARLIRDFPTSKYTPNAFLTFGDLKFSEGDIHSAARLYNKIVDGYPDSPVFAFALYKLAWCHLNPVGSAAPDYPKSLALFVAAIEATKRGRAGTEANARLIRRDARRDMVRAFVHAGKPSKAWPFFTKYGRGPKKSETMVRDMMERLGTAYFGEGMYVASSATYHELKRRFPADPDTCSWQHRIVINALATDDPGIQWTEAQRLAQAYRERGKSWSKTHTKRCKDATRETLSRLATIWHDEADKTGRDETYVRASEAYVVYAELFSDTKAAYELAYYHGEVLWQRASRLLSSKKEPQRRRGRALFRDAALQFNRVLAMKPKGKWAREAAYAQMLGWKNHLDYDEMATARRGCHRRTDGRCRAGGNASDQYDEIPLAADEAAMLRAYDQYAKYISGKDDPELVKILYHRARLFVEHNDFEAARPHLERLVREFDGTVHGVWAAEMLLDVLTIDWGDSSNSPRDVLSKGAELEKVARKLLESESIRHREAVGLRKAVPRMIATVGWVEAGAHHERGRNGDPEGYVDCGRKYRALYLEFDEHDRADELLFNSARCLEAGFLLGQAISLREELLAQFPDSKLASQTLRDVAENYQRIAYYDRAAGRFEEYAARNPKDDYSAQALQNAYLFRVGLGDESKASEDLQRYEKMFRRKDPMRAAKIFWARHDLIESDDDKLSHAEQYIATYGTKGGKDRLAVAHAAAGGVLWRKSCPRQMLQDSCITVKRVKAGAGQGTLGRATRLRRRAANRLGQRCGEETQAVVSVHRRDSKLVRRAQQHFERAASLARRASMPEDSEREAALRRAWGMAEVYQADEIYEQYLAVQMPDGLDFGLEHRWKEDSGIPRLEREYAAAMKRRAASTARFEKFFHDKDALAAELVRRYAGVSQTGSPHWVLAAAARAAMVNQNFADQLYRAPVPRGLKTTEQRDLYCDELATYAAVPEKRALDALDYCLRRSTEYQYFNDYSRLCEEELQQRDADRYPATNELFGTSVYTESQMDRVGVQTELTTQERNQ